MANDVAKTSTIKGYLVRIYLKEFEREAGTSGLKALRKQYGKPLDFGNSDLVETSEKIKLLGHMADILSKKQISGGERDFEIGNY